MGALKNDAGKPRTDLMPFEALLEVSKVLAFGATKYNANNWKKGMAWSRLLGSATRHIFYWGAGQRIDKESGQSHLAHACANLLFLLSYELWKIGEDDL